MNKYQRQRSKEIKEIMAKDKFGRTTYAQARRVWNFLRRVRWGSPCEDCDRMFCGREFKPIVFCPQQR